MDALETESLFSAITAHLSGTRIERSEQDVTFWDGHTRISPAELDLLMALTGGPLSAEAVAFRLEQDILSTITQLDALIAAGIIERAGENYAITAAAKLFCKVIGQGR